MRGLDKRAGRNYNKKPLEPDPRPGFPQTQVPPAVSRAFPEKKEAIVLEEKGIEGSMAALPYMATKEQRERINDNLFAISKLKQYISSIERDAEKAMYVLEHPEEIEGGEANE